jgi:hypothetical protein
MKIILGCDIKELLTTGQGVMLSFQAVSLCFFKHDLRGIE